MRQERNLTRRGFLGALCACALAGSAALAGCGRSSGASDAADVTEGTAKEAAAANAAEGSPAAAGVANTSATDEKPKVLIAYFSGTGHTARVAIEMAARTGADLFPLEPVVPYTTDDLDYSDPQSRVRIEYADEDLRDVPLVASVPDNFDTYDAVIIGFPIWWENAAWPVLPFCEDNDFHDMSYAAFCTSDMPLPSDETQLGDARDTIRTLIGTDVDYVAGARFMPDESLSTVDAWVENLAFTTRAQKMRDREREL